MGAFLTKNFQFLVILIIGIFLYFSTGLSKGCKGVHYGNDTATRSDTGYRVIVIQSPVYVPVQTGLNQPIIIPSQYQPSSDPNVVIKQYQDLLQKYFAQNKSEDTIRLKDDSSREVGQVAISDVISQNQNMGRSWKSKLNFPTITNTVTIKEPYKPVFQAYLGAEITGGIKNYITGLNAVIGLKTPKDKIFLFKGGFQNITGKLEPQFGASYLTKIKLKK